VELLLRANYIEKLGTGIDRIKKVLSSAHLPPPEFHYDSFFSITIPRDIGELEASSEEAENKEKKVSASVEAGDDIVNSAESEEDEFSDTVSDIVGDIVNDTVDDTVDDTVKERLIRISELLYKEPGMRSNAIAEATGVSWSTVQRDLKKLGPLVRFEGAPKTGGYYLSEDLKEKLDTIK
jgi:predicted HTH transcriptional regulator